MWDHMKLRQGFNLIHRLINAKKKGENIKQLEHTYTSIDCLVQNASHKSKHYSSEFIV